MKAAPKPAASRIGFIDFSPPGTLAGSGSPRGLRSSPSPERHATHRQNAAFNRGKLEAPLQQTCTFMHCAAQNTATIHGFRHMSIDFVQAADLGCAYARIVSRCRDSLR
jgi:hypothetical protein